MSSSRKQTAHDRLDHKQFSLAVKRLADTLSYGADLSPFLGSGIDYVQSRLYAPGDPMKSIDWRITARTGKTYVKEYEAPKQLPIYIVLDTSASMCVSSLKMSKYAWAVQIATGLGMVAIERMSPVGLMGCGERKLHMRPSLSRGDILRWAHELRHYDLNESTSLTETLKQLSIMMPDQSLVLVISDLHEHEATDALKRLNQQHDTIVLMMQDPAERGKLGGGIFRAKEAESGHSFTTSGSRQWLDESATLDELRRAGVDCLTLPTDEVFLPRLRNFLKHRDYAGKSRL